MRYCNLTCHVLYSVNIAALVRFVATVTNRRRVSQNPVLQIAATSTVRYRTQNNKQNQYFFMLK